MWNVVLVKQENFFCLPYKNLLYVFIKSSEAKIPKVGRVPLLRRMPGSVYTLPVPAILSSQILNTKNQRNVYLQKKIMIRMMPKNMIMQMISQKNLGMEITMRGMTMLMITGKKEIR